MANPRLLGIFLLTGATLSMISASRASAACNAPKFSLEQTGSTVQVHINNTGCPEVTYFRLDFEYWNFYTNRVYKGAKAYYHYASKVLATDYNVTPPPFGEGLYKVAIMACISTSTTTPATCTPRAYEEIYFVANRDAYASNYGMGIRYPVAPADYPSDLTFRGFCSAAKTTDCYAFTDKVDANFRGYNRLVFVSSEEGYKPYPRFYQTYGDSGTFYKQFVDWYGNPTRDPKYLDRFIQGIIDSGNFNTHPATGRNYMMIRLGPELYVTAVDMAKLARMLSRLVVYASNPDSTVYRNRFTLLSLYRMLMYSFQVDYDQRIANGTERGGFKTKVESANSVTKYIDNYLIGFGGGIEVDDLDAAGNPTKQKPIVTLGKTLQTYRELIKYALPTIETVASRFYDIDIAGDSRAIREQARSQILRLGGEEKASNFVLSSFSKIFATDSSVQIPYGFYVRDSDWMDSAPTRMVYLARTTNLSKACGGFGGYLYYSGNYNPISGTDIGQMMHLYWSVYDVAEDDNADIPSLANTNRSLNNGWGQMACNATGTDCSAYVNRIKDQIEIWRNACCTRIHNWVYVLVDGRYVRLSSLSDTDLLARPEYPLYCH